MAIPKIIHYCWFGKNPLPAMASNCIKSWEAYCPDYEIRCWDESNFDVSQYPYMKETYDAGKWAFVTDIARLLVVYQYGGIYLDTDVELIKPLDELLEYSAYFGYEGDNINTGLGFGAEKGNAILRSLLDDYEGIHFVQEDGEFDVTPCPLRNSRVIRQLGFECDGTYRIKDNILFLPEEYLCPMNWRTREMINLTDNTISIHHYDASWKKWYNRDKYKNRDQLEIKDRPKYWIAKGARFINKSKKKVKKYVRKDT